MAHNLNMRNGRASMMYCGEAAYNGVVEFVDYGLPTLGRGGRLNSIWFGEGQYIKARAYDKAVSLILGRN